jgi:hypothetical protein
VNANKHMRELLEQGAELTEIYVPSPFQMLVGGGFVEAHGCVFLRRLFHHGPLTGLAQHDLTGKECFVNSFHLEDYLEKGMSREAPALAVTAVKCVDWLAERLRRFSADPFQIIFSVDGRHSVMRFHKVRDGESWLDDDLEGYQEAVAVYGVT